MEVGLKSVVKSLEKMDPKPFASISLLPGAPVYYSIYFYTFLFVYFLWHASGTYVL